MKTRTAWIVYSLLRIVFFAVPFAALMVLLPLGGIGHWPTIFISVAVAALISISLSVLLLSTPRDAASESIYAWRNSNRTADDEAEDAVLDETHPETIPGPVPSEERDN